MKQILGRLFLLLNCLVSYSQPATVGTFAPPARAPVIYAAEASEPIRVDGKVNEACWRNAPLVNNFFRIEPAGYANNQFSRVGEHRLDVTIDVYSAELRLAYNPRIQASRFYQYNSLDQQGRWK